MFIDGINLFPFSGMAQSYQPSTPLESDSLLIPMKRAGRVFLIEAEVDGVPGNLVFDTGAQNLVINGVYFRDHVRTDAVSSNGITGAAGEGYQITVGKLAFASLTYERLRADVADLGHLENKWNVKILGLIGFGMLKDYELELDVRNSTLKLFRLDKSGKRTGRPHGQFRADYTQEFYEKSNIVYLKAEIGGKLLQFCLDTGAETNVINSCINKKILNTVSITRRKVLKGAGSASSEVLYGKMDEFRISDINLTGMSTIITNLCNLNEAYGKTINGMLGYTFMEKGIICINFKTGLFSMRFWEGGPK
ncbi:MAG: aspartyl protease family protein [Mangrovibacterium sp.]